LVSVIRLFPLALDYIRYFHLGVMVSFHVGGDPAGLDRFLRTPLQAGETHLAVIRRDRSLVKQGNIIDGARSLATASEFPVPEK